jgi:multiple sugar transport system ATP-binding protein
MAVREGEDVGLTFAPADAHVFDAQGRVMRRRQAPALAA